MMNTFFIDAVHRVNFPRFIIDCLRCTGRPTFWFYIPDKEVFPATYGALRISKVFPTGRGVPLTAHKYIFPGFIHNAIFFGPENIHNASS